MKIARISSENSLNIENCGIIIIKKAIGIIKKCHPWINQYAYMSHVGLKFLVDWIVVLDTYLN